jgi:hypothetical protein
VDVVSNGANDKLAKRAITSGDMPEGVYRSVVVPFTYTGGAAETRVDWAGSIPLVIDAVTLYQVQ